MWRQPDGSCQYGNGSTDGIDGEQLQAGGGMNRVVSMCSSATDVASARCAFAAELLQCMPPEIQSAVSTVLHRQPRPYSYYDIDRQILPTPRRCLTFDEVAPKAQLVGVCCKAGRLFCSTFGTNDIYCAQEGTWGNKTYAEVGTYCTTARFPVSSDATARLCCDFGRYPLPDGKEWVAT
jgi:hypothetical protein